MVGTLVLIAAVITVLKPLYDPAKKINDILVRIATRRQSANAKHARMRAQFADHVESQIRRLAEKEEWRDDRFIELDAMVEIESHNRHPNLRRLVQSRSEGLRRVTLLSVALERSKERLIILEGEPGSGKSLTLRYLAQRVARHAMRKPSEKSIIPIYVNLREFRPSKHPVDHTEIRNFILHSLNQANNREVDDFLEEEFDSGVKEGTWLFLLDSFDEIPDVLSAVQVDAVVEEYADAFYEFLHSFSRSRGIIASREFRGPHRFGWPKFTIVGLSARQKKDLIDRADLSKEAEEELAAGLTDADPSIAQLADNPLFLGLLCEHIRHGEPFPSSSHAVFESYVTTRLQRDASRVQEKFQVTPDMIRVVAEETAFSMATIGSLEPTRNQIRQAVASPQVLANLDSALSALEYIKLAHSSEDSEHSDHRPFTFTHHRFQEYFATCVVLREPDRVSIDTLLTDGRWREATVTVLQSQHGDSIGPLTTRAAEMMQEMAAQVSANISTTNMPKETHTADGRFRWPPGSLHLLGLLNAGQGKHPDQIPAEFRSAAGQLLDSAWQLGRRHDRKWAVESITVASTTVAMRVLEESFASDSKLLRQSAYFQAGRINQLPPIVERNLRKALVGQSCSGQLRSDRLIVRAQLKRLAEPAGYLQGINFLLIAPIIDFILLFMSSFIAGSVSGSVHAGQGCGQSISAVQAVSLGRAVGGCRACPSPCRVGASVPQAGGNAGTQGSGY